MGKKTKQNNNICGKEQWLHKNKIFALSDVEKKKNF